MKYIPLIILSTMIGCFYLSESNVDSFMVGVFWTCFVNFYLKKTIKNEQ